MTTCPSGVDYRRLVDHARAAIETTYQRPLRRPPDARRAGVAAAVARAVSRSAWRWPRSAGPSRRSSRASPRVGDKLAAMLALAPQGAARAARRRAPANSRRRRRAPSGAASRCSRAARKTRWRLEINAATIRLLNRAGDRRRAARGRRLLRLAAASHGPRAHERSIRCAPTSTPGFARPTAPAWRRSSSPRRAAARRSRTTASCCATIPPTPKRRTRVAALAKDVCEYVAGLDLTFANPKKLVVAYHAACSLQHGQKILEAPKALLRRAGFEVRTPPGGPHLLRLGGHLQYPAAGNGRGAARTESRQPLARETRRHRRRQHRLPHANRQRTSTPVVHTVELLDWASGGPKPAGLG